MKRRHIKLVNYIKFAVFQFIGFLLSIFKLRKFLKFPNKFSMKKKFSFLQKQAKNSLKLVNIDVKIIGVKKVPK